MPEMLHNLQMLMFQMLMNVEAGLVRMVDNALMVSMDIHVHVLQDMLE